MAADGYGWKLYRLWFSTLKIIQQHFILGSSWFVDVGDNRRHHYVDSVNYTRNPCQKEQ